MLAEALAEGQHSEEAISYFLTLRETQRANSLSILSWHAFFAKRETGKRRWSTTVRPAWEPGAGTAWRPGARCSWTLPTTWFYCKAIQLDGHDVKALTRAGRLLYRSGMFADAHELLEKALRQEPKAPQDRAEVAGIKALAEDAERIQQLTLGADLSPDTLSHHLRTDATIARARVNVCVAAAGSAGSVPAEWQALMTEMAGCQQRNEQAIRSAERDRSGHDERVDLRNRDGYVPRMRSPHGG